MVGDHLGRYTVRARIGAGAMGEVFEGYDPDLDRRVALKVMKVGLGGVSPGARIRFQREAQAMARLSDPNVVSVHDVDVVGERLFVAMELVHGPTLAAWIADGPHPWRDVVDVFAQACRGLIAAHEAGIIHRDFKPSNVILGDRVRVADFGLARALDSDEPARATSIMLLGISVTHTGQALGTPAYMAPEQRAGGPVTAAADQYAFCVALEEALQGTAAPRFLMQLVARGKSADPAQRYPSMRALLDALVRDPARIRRRIAVAVGVPVLVVASAWALASSPPACAPASSRLVGVWDTPRRVVLGAAFAAAPIDAAATWQRVRTRLDGYAGRWADAANDACRATRVEGRQSDAMLDLRMGCLDRRRAQLAALVELWSRGLDKDGVLHAIDAVGELPTLAECADARALGERVALPGDPASIAKITAARAEVDQVRALTLAHRWVDAKAKVGLACTLADATGWAPVRAEAAYSLGAVLADLSDPGAQAPLLDAARLAGEAHDDTLHANALLTLIDCIASDDKQAERALLLADAAQGVIARAGDDPVLAARLALGRAAALYTAGKAADARDLLLHARVRAAGDDIASTIALRLVQVESALGNYAGAVEAGTHAIAALEAKLGPEDPQVGRALGIIGKSEILAGTPAAAVAHFRRALPIVERAAGAESIPAAGVHSLIGSAELRLGHYPVARAAIERALAIEEKLLGPNHPSLVSEIDNLALVLRLEGRHAEAVALLQRALAIDVKTYGESSANLMHPLLGLAGVFQDRGERSEALRYYRQAAAVGEKSLGKDHPRTLAAKIFVGNILGDQHHCGDAMAMLVPAIAGLESKPEAAENEDLALGLTAAAHCDLEVGQPRAALERLDRALAILDQAKADLYQHGEVHALQARAFWAVGRRDDAAAAAHRAERELPTEAGGVADLAELHRWMSSHHLPPTT